MSAGTGIEHSEYNASPKQAAHMLQMWVLPSVKGLAPNYQQRSLAPVREGETRLDLIASSDGRDGSLTISQDVLLYRATIAGDSLLSIPIPANRHAWVQVARGIAEIDGGELREGDGLAVSRTETLTFTTKVGAELLVYDLA